MSEQKQKDPTKNPSKFSPTQKAIAAVSLTAAGFAGGYGAARATEGSESHPPVVSMKPTTGGTEVPKGYNAPVGSTTEPVPGYPGETMTHYGTTPDGQTPSPAINADP